MKLDIHKYKKVSGDKLGSHVNLSLPMQSEVQSCLFFCIAFHELQFSNTIKIPILNLGH